MIFHEDFGVLTWKLRKCHGAKVILLAAAVLLFVSVLFAAQVPDAKAEALVNCPTLVQPEPLTPYGFAKATLVSLWYARNAAERGTQLKSERKDKDTETPFSLLTAMMVLTKTSTNDFICAKRSVKPFAVKQSSDNIKTAADFLAVVYDEHISLNQRLIELLKKLDSTNQGELMDQISTLQVERDQRWADLVNPTALTLASLIDVAHADENGHASRLVITKAQKQGLLDWANEHFTEFRDGTPEAQWLDPAKTAQMYFSFFKGRTCSDE